MSDTNVFVALKMTGGVKGEVPGDRLGTPAFQGRSGDSVGGTSGAGGGRPSMRSETAFVQRAVVRSGQSRFLEVFDGAGKNRRQFCG